MFKECWWCWPNSHCGGRYCVDTWRSFVTAHSEFIEWGICFVHQLWNFEDNLLNVVRSTLWQSTERRRARQRSCVGARRMMTSTLMSTAERACWVWFSQSWPTSAAIGSMHSRTTPCCRCRLVSVCNSTVRAEGIKLVIVILWMRSLMESANDKIYLYGKNQYWQVNWILFTSFFLLLTKYFFLIFYLCSWLHMTKLTASTIFHFCVSHFVFTWSVLQWCSMSAFSQQGLLSPPFDSSCNLLLYFACLQQLNFFFYFMVPKYYFLLCYIFLYFFFNLQSSPASFPRRVEPSTTLTPWTPPGGTTSAHGHPSSMHWPSGWMRKALLSWTGVEKCHLRGVNQPWGRSRCSRPTPWPTWNLRRWTRTGSTWSWVSVLSIWLW